MNRKLTILGLLLTGLLLPLMTGSIVEAQLNLNNVSPLPPTRLLNRYGLQQGWWAQATVDGNRDKVSHIALDEKAVVVMSTSGILTMLDAETGQKIWTNRVGRKDQATSLPVLNERHVFVTSGLNMYAIDRLNGRLSWQIDLPKMPSAGPAADENQVYVATMDGSVYAFDLRKIRTLYQERRLPDYTNTAQVWRYQAGAKVTSPPITNGRMVLFASRDHSLYAVTAGSRRLLFQFETDGPVSAPLVMHDSQLYLACEDFNFYCLNAHNGQVRWSFLSGFAIRKPPHVIEGNYNGKREDIVYVLPEQGGISAILARNGREIWPAPQFRATQFLAATARNLYVSDQNGNTLLVDREDGSLIGSLPTISFDKKVSNDRTDRLFLARHDGLIVMVREEAAVFPTYHQFPDRRPILPELFDPELHSDEAAQDATEASLNPQE